jgi:sulfur carrier protein ThiS
MMDKKPAKLILREQEFIIPAGMTLRSAFFKVDLQPESYLAIRDGEMITDDEILQEGDKIILIAVISGG